MVIKKRIVFVDMEISLLRYGRRSQLRSFDCDCGESKALETRSTIWVQCSACKKQYNG